MINRTTKRQNTGKIKNEEGYSVYRMRDDQALFLEASAFVPRNSYYTSLPKKLELFEQLIDRNITKELQYVLALVWYLGKQLGIRLSPVIMLTRVMMTRPAREIWGQITKIIKSVFTRPDFIANSLSYWKFRNENSIKNIPTLMRFAYKAQFETYSDMTLKRRKMRRREFKLKDLIKILKPVPKNNDMSKLYRSIIEDGDLSKLKTKINAETGKIESTDHITAAISNDCVSHAEKRRFVQQAINKIPINALIKNLSFLTGDQAKALKTRLESIFKSGDGMRFINPFDLILLENLEFGRHSRGPEVNVDSQILNTLDYILSKYITINVDSKNPVILYDRSGSMVGQNHLNGSKFVAMLGSLFERNFKFYTFSAGGWGSSSKLPGDLEDITDVLRSKMERVSGAANQIAREFFKSIDCNGGTELLGSTEWVIKNNPNADLLVIITDEVTWAEEGAIERFKRLIPEHLSGKVIMINVDPRQKSIFKPTAKVTRISGLDGKVLTLLKAIANFDQFKSEIISMFVSTDVDTETRLAASNE